jgi:hypothetical protein
MRKEKKRAFNFIKINEDGIVLSKKGLSAIVTTLIIILLVLVAVGIVWVIVRNIVQEGAEGIGLGKFTLDLEIKTAQITDGDVTVVVIRRNPGEGNYTGMNFIFSDGTNSEIIRENTILEETEVKNFTFTLTQISTSNLRTISVAPVFELSSGEESIGDIADSFEITEEMREGITGGAISNFEALGFEGMGVVNYSISSGGEDLPEFRRAIVDPLDVLPGHNQTFTVHVYSPYGVVNVTSLTELDNSTLYLDFEKTDEFVIDNETIEIWSASWIVNDTHAIEYKTNVTAIDSQGNSNSITLTWTDSCQSDIMDAGGHGADRTISTDCATIASATGGLDGGSLTIQSGRTMTISPGSTWAFNDGKSITPNGNVGVDGQIRKGYLFYTDIDGDNYSDDTELLFSTNPSPSQAVRAKDALGTNDCCDVDADARPGQTTYYTTANDCANFDYNCNGYGDPQWYLYTGAQCWDCYYEIDVCGILASGSAGWEGSAPACGVSGTYIIDPGLQCTSRSPLGQEICETYCYGASQESRTQACR